MPTNATPNTRPFIHFRADRDIRLIVEKNAKRFGSRSAFIRNAIRHFYASDVSHVVR